MKVWWTRPGSLPLADPKGQVVLLAREPRQVEHDDEVDPALVQAAVPEQPLELAAVRGLGALAFLVEAFKDS